MSTRNIYFAFYAFSWQRHCQHFRAQSLQFYRLCIQLLFALPMAKTQSKLNKKKKKKEKTRTLARVIERRKMTPDYDYFALVSGSQGN